MKVCTPLLFTFTILWVTAPGVQAADDEVKSLLDKVAKTYGGLENLKKLKGIKQSGELHSGLRGGKSPISRAYQYPDRLRVEIYHSGGATETRLLAGDQAWKQGSPASKPFQISTLLQAARMGLPYILLDNRERVRDEGNVDGPEGKKLRAVSLPLGDEANLVAEIDPASGRILRSRGQMRMKEMAMEFGTIYHDFRTQDGILYPAKEDHYAGSMQTGHTQIEKTEFSQQLPEKMFHP